MKRALKKTEFIGFWVTQEQKRQMAKLAAHFRQSTSDFMRHLALAEIGKWSTVVSVEEPAEVPRQPAA